jgi:hypothetical protein
LLITGSTIATASNYYVSPSGSNSNPGTDIANAWETISYMASKTTISGGDTVFLRGGTYTDTMWLHGWHGTDTLNPIVISSYPGETAIIRSPQNLPQFSGCIKNGLVRIRACSFLQLQKMRIVSPHGFGIWVTDTSHNIVIAENIIDSCAQSAITCMPIKINCEWTDTSRQTHIKILNDTINFSNLIAYSLEGISLRWVDTFEIANVKMIKNKQEGIAITRGSHGTIHHNTIIDPTPDYDTISGQPVWSDTLNIRAGVYLATCDSIFSTRDISIYNNCIQGATVGIMINTEHNASVDSVSVYNNVLLSNYFGISSSQCYTSKGEKRHVTIAHNTIRSTNIDFRIADTIQHYKDWKIFNNLLAGLNTYGVRIKRVSRGTSFHNGLDSACFVFKNNVFTHAIPYGYPPVQSGTDTVLVGQCFTTGESPNTLGLVDTTGSTVDLHITASSVAHDAGTMEISYPHDYDDFDRPYNDSTDIGAHEFHNP